MKGVRDQGLKLKFAHFDVVPDFLEIIWPGSSSPMKGRTTLRVFPVILIKKAPLGCESFFRAITRGKGQS